MATTTGTGVHIRGIPRDKAPEPRIDGSLIASERYWSPEFAQLEWERLWPHVWLVAGRTDQLAEAGDYVTYDIGRDSVLAILGEDDRIRVFHNVCQHRGNRLVAAEVGSLAGAEVHCAYHGWRYGTDGRLNWVPDEDDFAQGSPCGVRNLIELPSDTWAGFIWFSLDADIAPLRTWLDPVADHLDGYRMETMKRTHWVTLEGDFNWKCVQDNFNESYHLPYVHPETVASMDHHHSGCQFDLYPSGHCRMLMPGGGPGPHYQGRPERTFKTLQQELEFWEIDPEPYRDDLPALREAMQRRKRELGAAKGYDFSLYSDEQLTDHYHYTVFPNLSFSMKPDGCIWLRATPHPTDPEKTYFDMWYLTLFPEGVTEYYSNSIRDWVSVDHQAEHQIGRVGDVSCGHAIDQDVAIWASQHLGLRSRGYRGAYLPQQEQRIQYFHENIDRYLAGTRSLSERVDLDDLSDLPDGQMRAFPDVGRYGIVVCRVGGSLYALDDNCSHADTPLSTGRLRGTTVTCPLHGAQFDVRDGSHAGPPAYTGVPCHRVDETATGAVVHIETSEPIEGYGEPGAAFRTR